MSFEAQKEHFQKWYCVIKEGLHCLDGLLVCTCVTVFSHTGRFVIRLFNQGLLQRLNHSEFYFILFLMSSSFLNIYSETTTQHKIADFTHFKKNRTHQGLTQFPTWFIFSLGTSLKKKRQNVRVKFPLRQQVMFWLWQVFWEINPQGETSVSLRNSLCQKFRKVMISGRKVFHCRLISFSCRMKLKKIHIWNLANTG